MSILEADHARIVAEATAEARAAERRHWEARFRNMEQSHALALAKQKAQCIEHQANAVAAERENHAAALLTQDRQHMEALAEAVQRGRAEQLLYPSATAHEPAAAPRTLTRDGWWPFGSFVDYDFPLEFDGEGEDGLPIWERPDKSRMQPRTLTADDPEPAVTSVGLDRDQSVWQRVGSTEHSRWVNPFMGTREWSDVLARGPVRLIHDGEDR